MRFIQSHTKIFNIYNMEKDHSTVQFIALQEKKKNL